MIEEQLLKLSAAKLTELSGRIQDCLGKLTADQIWMRNSDNENSIGNLVLHLCGNARQWIGSGVGDKPDIRQRGAEFAARGGIAPAELASRLQTTVSEATGIILQVDPALLLERRTIQNNDVTIMEAILQVVQHFAQHTGQIMFATKLLTGQDLGYYKHLNEPRWTQP